jgi:4-oxalocrotonate tautomerase
VEVDAHDILAHLPAGSIRLASIRVAASFRAIAEISMPLVRIDLLRGKSSDYLRALRDAIHEAMRETFDVTSEDRFILITQHSDDEFDCNASYAGMARTKDLVIVQIACNTTRGLREKQALYKRMNELLVSRCMLHPDDLFINLIETPRLNWSFGRGEP